MKTLIMKLALLVSVVSILGSCSSPKPEKTIENLKSAITGETRASAKYAAFAQKAAEEGYPNISKMFKAASAAEAIHVKNHNAVLTKLKEPNFELTVEAAKVDSTANNIKIAIDGETYEFTEMYPQFIKVARDENSKDAIITLTWAQDSEKRHADLYASSLSILKLTGKDATVSSTWYVCPKCGNLYHSIDGLDNCELCATKSASFQTF